MSVKAGFDPNQVRDPHTGEWIDVPGVGSLEFDTSIGESARAGVAEAASAVQEAVGRMPASRIVSLPDSDAATARAKPNGDLAIHGDVSKETAASAAVHEMGHMVDRELSPEDSDFLTESEEGAALRQVIYDSPTVQAIRNDEVPILAGDTQLRNQLLQGREIFARAFEQYVAIHGGSRLLQAYLRRTQADQNLGFQFWPDGEFERIEAALERLFAAWQRTPKSQGGRMQHKTLEAKATITDLGEFTALAAAFTVDRMNERILPGAFKGTIGRWQESGKQIPLHWDHSGDAENIIGTVDPASMNETDEGLEVKGKLDLEDSEVAREAWRSMKKNRIGLSFGYLVTDDGEGDDGIRELKAVDLFEVSVTPAPANPDTRFIDMKSATASTATDATVTLSGDAVWQKWASEHIVDELHAHEDPKPSEDAKPIEEKLARQLKSGYDGVVIDMLALGVNPDVTELSESPELPDSAFLYIGPDGQKDAEGKTAPRSLRRFAVKDASGAVDTARVHDVLARILQSNLPQDAKDHLTQKAQALLASEQAMSEHKAEKAIEDARDEEPETAKSEAQDPLRKRYDELALELSTRGITLYEPPKVEEKPTDDPPSMEELRRKNYDLMLEIQIGSENQ